MALPPLALMSATALSAPALSPPSSVCPFEQAGADVLYAPSLPNLEAIRQVCASVSKPVNVLMGLKGATFSVEELAAAGAKRISVGGSFARAALGAFVRAAREVKDKGTFTYATEAISHADATKYMEKP